MPLYVSCLHAVVPSHPAVVPSHPAIVPSRRAIVQSHPAVRPLHPAIRLSSHAVVSCPRSVKQSQFEFYVTFSQVHFMLAKKIFVSMFIVYFIIAKSFHWHNIISPLSSYLLAGASNSLKFPHSYWQHINLSKIDWAFQHPRSCFFFFLSAQPNPFQTIPPPNLLLWPPLQFGLGFFLQNCLPMFSSFSSPPSPSPLPLSNPLKNITKLPPRLCLKLMSLTPTQRETYYQQVIVSVT